ncbi:hypothetical protein IDJ77_21240 [Mucilaginibacter sp. ZT4R22]|uniref:Lipoprotein n=1 Tax=Mucilaginibacter pankratovii TaxID=2772110 RepID=A0ABR7WXM7_9SPHI|nr:hypothetical protein [Mucilaginibacter pankratovii]MBD1366352.1 hypothetical protein [Mucilaginibacter pankratovii]
MFNLRKSILLLPSLLAVLLLTACDPGYSLYVKNQTTDTVSFSVGIDLLIYPRNQLDSARFKSHEVYNSCFTGVGYKLAPKEEFFVRPGSMVVYPSPAEKIQYIKIIRKGVCDSITDIKEVKKNLVLKKFGNPMNYRYTYLIR